VAGPRIALIASDSHYARRRLCPRADRGRQAGCRRPAQRSRRASTLARDGRFRHDPLFDGHLRQSTHAARSSRGARRQEVPRPRTRRDRRAQSFSRRRMDGGPRRSAWRDHRAGDQAIAWSLQVASSAVLDIGERRHLLLLRVANIEPKELASAIIADTEFGVERRTLRTWC